MMTPPCDYCGTTEFKLVFIEDSKHAKIPMCRVCAEGCNRIAVGRCLRGSAKCTGPIYPIHPNFPFCSEECRNVCAFVTWSPKLVALVSRLKPIDGSVVHNTRRY